MVAQVEKRCIAKELHDNNNTRTVRTGKESKEKVVWMVDITAEWLLGMGWMEIWHNCFDCFAVKLEEKTNLVGGGIYCAPCVTRWGPCS